MSKYLNAIIHIHVNIYMNIYLNIYLHIHTNIYMNIHVNFPDSLMPARPPHGLADAVLSIFVVDGASDFARATTQISEVRVYMVPN